MEIGYRASRKDIKLGEHGCWKYCREEDIRRIVGDNATSVKLSIMADAGKCDYREDIPAKKDSLVDLVRVACEALGIGYAILRLQNVYGEGQSLKNPYTGILSIFSTRIRRGLDLPIFEDGLESRDFVHVDDVSGGIGHPGMGVGDLEFQLGHVSLLERCRKRECGK